MKKRGRNFKGKVCGSGVAAELQRAEIRNMNTEVVALRIQAAQPGEPLRPDQVLSIAIGARLALEDVRTGTGDGEGVGWLVNAANLSMIIGELGIGGDHLGKIRESQDALMRMIGRHERTGRYALDGPGLTACIEMMDVHQAQLKSADMTDQLMRRALRICNERQAAGQVLELAAA